MTKKVINLRIRGALRGAPAREGSGQHKERGKPCLHELSERRGGGSEGETSPSIKDEEKFSTRAWNVVLSGFLPLKYKKSRMASKSLGIPFLLLKSKEYQKFP